MRFNKRFDTATKALQYLKTAARRLTKGGYEVEWRNGRHRSFQATHRDSGKSLTVRVGPGHSVISEVAA